MYDLAHHAHERVFVPCITSRMILEGREHVRPSSSCSSASVCTMYNL